MDNNLFKLQMEAAKKVMELNNIKIKSMISNNLKRIEEIQLGEVKEVTKGGINTKRLVITFAALAGISFIAGRKEGFKLGFKTSKDVHRAEGYNNAMREIVKRFGGK